MIDEGYTKYACEWRRTPPLPAELVAGLNGWRSRLHDEGLIGYDDEQGVGFGNVSIREGDSATFIISGTQTGHIARADETHYCRVRSCDIAANRVRCEGPVQASSEALTHAAIYALDPAIRAVVHVHDKALWRELKDSVPTTARDAAYGTPAMANEFARLYRETGFARDRIAVMGGHDDGIVSFGSDIGEAARRILCHRYRIGSARPGGVRS